MSAKYPKIKVRLTGTDGNAFAILGKVSGALRKAKVPANEVARFYASATKGDYNDLLYTCSLWVEIS